MAVNLASKYANKVDERFTRDSQALLATNKDYDWNGVDSVKVYQVDTVPTTGYTRSGASRYGTPSELGNTIQTMTLTQDRAFTFTIDRGNKIQSQMVMDAGKSLAREQREVLVPEFDTYVFKKMGEGAVEKGHVEVGTAASTNAYSKFLAASEALGNKNVPDVGRIAFCSYGFSNLLMLDPAFMKYGEKSQNMVIKGILGEVDGTRIVKVPASRLPIGTSFLVAHPSAVCAPQQLVEYKIHENPPGISGWLVEGRHIYDAFVLNGKADALYIGMLGGVLGSIDAEVEAGALNVKSHNIVGELKIKAGSTLPAFGDADTGYTAIAQGGSVSAASILAVVVDGKIIAAKLLSV